MACTLYGNQGHCNYKGNCSLLSWCACKIANRLCTSLCHGGRGKNKLCKIMDDFDDLSSPDEDDGNEDDAYSVSSRVHVVQLEQV